MDVSVIIVNWNTRELLANCIASLREKTHGVSYEVIVVDNNSADRSAEFVAERFPECKLVASEENLGFSRGNNRGLREASGKYVLFLNPDTVLATNALLGMFQFMEDDPRVGAVGCRLLNPDGSLQFVCARTFPTLWNQFCSVMLLSRLFPRMRIFSGIEMTWWDHRDSRDIDCLTGACIFARKPVLDSLGGFDEALFMYADDVDLCFRIRQAGWRIHYLPEEAIYHLEGQSTRKRPQKFFSTLVQRESNRYFFRKHHGLAASWLYQGVTGLGALLRLCVAAASMLDLRTTTRNSGDRSFLVRKYAHVLLWSLRLEKGNF